MSNKNFKGIIKELDGGRDIFMGYPHRKHRTKKSKKHKNNKHLLLNKVIDSEHKEMMSFPQKSL